MNNADDRGDAMDGEAAKVIPSDNPVATSSQDTLERFPVAQSFVSQVLSVDASEGAVVGVLGRWGSGKTSFINFARSGFEAREIVILDFNPWMFSGAEQLVDSFFIELSAQLRSRDDAQLERIASALSDYGEVFSGLAWLPVVGPWIERGLLFSKQLGKLLARRNEGIGERKQALTAALEKLDKPIVVVLDDIDRLTTDEIRHVFKLVRLTASFPNIIYVLAFDRIRVEKALDEQGIPGRDYLEKIIQVTVDLPEPSKNAIAKQVFEAVDNALEGIENFGPFDDQAWPDIAAEVVLPLVSTMRDVRRYAAAVHGTVLRLQGQVALQDVLGMEAIRIFKPDVFLAMSKAVEGLTSTDSGPYGGNEEREKKQIESVMNAAPDDPDVVRAAFERLFPAARSKSVFGGSNYGSGWAKTWLAKRRVASGHILRMYFEAVQGEELAAFGAAEKLFAVLDDKTALESGLELVDINQRENVIGSLESFEDEFKPEQVVPGIVVLLNQWPKLPERERGMFDADARLVVGRVTYRLIRSLPDRESIVAAARKALPQIETLGAQFELVTDLGYREGAGHQLISEDDARAIEVEWAQRVSEATAGELMVEPDLLRTLYWATEIRAENNQPPIAIPNESSLTLQILRTGRTYARSQSMGSRAVRKALRLPWSTIESVLGVEAAIRTRVQAVPRDDLDAEDEELLELADKYLSGWRPREFGDDE